MREYPINKRKIQKNIFHLQDSDSALDINHFLKTVTYMWMDTKKARLDIYWYISVCPSVMGYIRTARPSLTGFTADKCAGSRISRHSVKMSSYVFGHVSSSVPTMDAGTRHLRNNPGTSSSVIGAEPAVGRLWSIDRGFISHP